MARDPAGAPGAAALTFGQRLRSLREAAGWSQEELAERARMSTEAVSALERGTRTRPYPATVRALAAALELAPDESRVLGCVYLYPHEEADVEVRMWVRGDAWSEGLDPLLEQAVRGWIDEAWPFERVLYRDR